jgi:diguanylate cyclase (GGDEF)-like protein
MNRWFPAFVILFGWASAAWATVPGALTTLHAVYSLSHAEAGHELPVAFEATVTYYRDADFDLFVQQDGEAVYVYFKQHAGLVPGDRVLVEGVTQDSFRPVVISEKVTLLHHGTAPRPRAANFDQLISAQLICTRVKVRATVRTADLVWGANSRIISLQLLTDGGYVDAVVNSEDANALRNLLDAQIEVTGVVAANFDGKKQLTGVAVWVQSVADMKVLKRASAGPESLPVTPMDQILSASHVNDLSRRVRVQGTITYYQPGSSIALQNGARSLWITTLIDSPMKVGDLVDVTGFPDARNGYLTLTHGEIRDNNVSSPIPPRPVTWREVGTGSNAFDFVSIEGKLLMEVREATQDEYVLISDGHLLSAIYRHPSLSSLSPLPTMVRVPLGSMVRIVGISMYSGSDPLNGPLASHMLLRSGADITVIAKPSGFSTGTLIRAVIALLVAVILIGAWGWNLQRSVHRQTKALAARNEEEAALERRRSRILEDINGFRPLAEIIEEITDMVSLGIKGAPCWCEIADGARLGNCPAEPSGLKIVHQDIPSRSGPPLGRFFVGLAPVQFPEANAKEAISQGARLATLAIETRKLYSDLLHRSEFDQLTDIHNRFSLARRMDSAIEEARRNAAVLGLIYVDLNEFKQVNDLYGHHVGDLYLQEVAQRMKEQLRSGDILARLGGDEFAVLVPVVRNRAHIEEIALRLEQSFDDPLTIEGYSLDGSASFGVALYPEDGATRESLLSAADAAMYVSKHARQQIPAES